MISSTFNGVGKRFHVVSRPSAFCLMRTGCFVLFVVWMCLKCELAPDLLAWIYLTFGLIWGSVAWVCLAHDLKKATVVIESTLLLCMIPLNCNRCTVCFDRNCFAVYVLLSNCVWSNRLFLDLNRRDVLWEPSKIPPAPFHLFSCTL